MFCTKNLAILLSFLKEFTESKKREKNVYLIIKERQKKPAQTMIFSSSRQAIICISRIIFQEYFPTLQSGSHRTSKLKECDNVLPEYAGTAK